MIQQCSPNNHISLVRDQNSINSYLNKAIENPNQADPHSFRQSNQQSLQGRLNTQDIGAAFQFNNRSSNLFPSKNTESLPKIESAQSIKILQPDSKPQISETKSLPHINSSDKLPKPYSINGLNALQQNIDKLHQGNQNGEIRPNQMSKAEKIFRETENINDRGNDSTRQQRDTQKNQSTEGYSQIQNKNKVVFEQFSRNKKPDSITKSLNHMNQREIQEHNLMNHNAYSTPILAAPQFSQKTEASKSQAKNQFPIPYPQDKNLLDIIALSSNQQSNQLVQDDIYKALKPLKRDSGILIGNFNTQTTLQSKPNLQNELVTLEQLHGQGQNKADAQGLKQRAYNHILRNQIGNGELKNPQMNEELIRNTHGNFFQMSTDEKREMNLRGGVRFNEFQRGPKLDEKLLKNNLFLSGNSRQQIQDRGHGLMKNSKRKNLQLKNELVITSNQANLGFFLQKPLKEQTSTQGGGGHLFSYNEIKEHKMTLNSLRKQIRKNPVGIASTLNFGGGLVLSQGLRTTDKNNQRDGEQSISNHYEGMSGLVIQNLVAASPNEKRQRAIQRQQTLLQNSDQKQQVLNEKSDQLQLRQQRELLQKQTINRQDLHHTNYNSSQSWARHDTVGGAILNGILSNYVATTSTNSSSQILARGDQTTQNGERKPISRGDMALDSFLGSEHRAKLKSLYAKTDQLLQDTLNYQLFGNQEHGLDVSRSLDGQFLQNCQDEIIYQLPQRNSCLLAQNNILNDQPEKNDYHTQPNSSYLDEGDRCTFKDLQSYQQSSRYQPILGNKIAQRKSQHLSGNILSQHAQSLPRLSNLKKTCNTSQDERAYKKQQSLEINKSRVEAIEGQDQLQIAARKEKQQLLKYQQRAGKSTQGFDKETKQRLANVQDKQEDSKLQGSKMKNSLKGIIQGGMKSNHPSNLKRMDSANIQNEIIGEDEGQISTKPSEKTDDENLKAQIDLDLTLPAQQQQQARIIRRIQNPYEEYQKEQEKMLQQRKEAKEKYSKISTTQNQMSKQQPMKFIIKEGNNHQIVQRIMNIRKRSFLDANLIQWEETTNFDSLYNFKWQPTSYGIKFDQISKYGHRQLVNHIEGHENLTTKDLLFINLKSFFEKQVAGASAYNQF